MYRGAWWGYHPWGGKELNTTEQAGTHTEKQPEPREIQEGTPTKSNVIFWIGSWNTTTKTLGANEGNMNKV